jgi:hypothetical protein
MVADIAARLRHVSDKDAGPARFLLRLHGKPLHQCDHVGMRPVAVARQPHHLPGLAVDRQALRAGDAAMGVEADHARLVGLRRQIFARKQFLGADLGVVRIGQRRQRLRIDGALVLRQRGRGAEAG